MVESLNFFSFYCYNENVGGICVKKGLLLALTFSLVCTMFYKVDATEFAGKEDEYTEKCKNTSQLSKKDLNVCKEFNDYLKNKNQSVKEQLDDTKGKLNETLDDLNEAKEELEKTKGQIDSLQNELDVVKGSVEQLSQNIQKKEDALKERLYVLQSYVNGGQLVNLIFSSGSFDELLNRIQSIDELTNYDKELIQGLASDKQELIVKQEDLQKNYDSLFMLHTRQSELQQTLSAAASDYQTSLDNQTTMMNQYNIEIGEIEDSISDANDRITAQEEEERRKQEELLQQQQQQKPQPNPEKPTTPTTPPSYGSGHQAVVNAALSKNGYPYVYGGTGPNGFDCSGLAQWAYKQAGISIPRTVRQQYYACTKISNPQPGDLVFFHTIGWMTHVGIYIGNNQFIHASTPGSDIYIASLSSSYWKNCYAGAGHFD